MVPEDPPPFQGGLHLDLEVLGQGHGGPSAPFVQVGCGHRKTRPADGAVQAQAVLGQVEETVGQRIARVVEPGHDALLVLRAEIALDEIRLSLVQVLAVDFPEHVGVHQVVRVEDHHQVVAVLIVAHGLQRLLQRDGLAGRRVRGILLRLDHLRAEVPGDLRRVVRAVVGDDVKVVQFFGIIHIVQVPDDIPDHLFLVMGRDQHQKPGLRVMILVVLLRFSETEKADHDLVDHDEGQVEPAYARYRLQEYPEQFQFLLPPHEGARPLRSHKHNASIKHHDALNVKLSGVLFSFILPSCVICANDCHPG